MSNEQLQITPATPAEQPKPMTAKSLFARDDVRAKFQEMLGKRATSFITSVLQIVASNKLLANADPNSIYQAAAVAATLDLPLNNSLGFAYIVPYNESYQDSEGQWKKKQVAQFQLGYKGFIQLAQRSGQFKTLSACPIYEGQIVEQNPLTGYVFDFSKKTSNTVIGYAAYFELINSFQKMMYMTVEEINRHGGRYSKTYSHEKGLWKTDFDAMAQKTVLKLLLSKFAPLSVEMQKAVIADQSKINDAETMDITYVDNSQMSIVDKEEERIQLMIDDCATISELKELQEKMPDVDVKLFDTRKSQILDAQS
jgi:recombination protein RecT